MNLNEFFNIGKEYFEGGLVATLIYVVIVALISEVLKKVVNKLTDKAISKKGKEIETAVSFARHVINFLINVICITLCLMQIKPFQSIGTAILGASSIFAVVIGFAAQETASNFIGGFFLSIYQPFKKGDLISIPSSNLQGRVQEITFRHTVIKTFNNTNVVVPNSIMNNSIIENKDDDTFYTNLIVFSVGYDSDIDKAISIILEETNKFNSLIEKATDVVVINLSSYSVDLRLTAITKDAADGFTFKCALNKVILEKFKENNIEIPYPYQNIIKK